MKLNSLLFPVLAFSLIALANFTPPSPAGPCDSPFVGGHTGAPGESSCTGCHGGTANTGSGTLDLMLSDTTWRYTPGEMFDATVTLRQAGRDKFGFVGLALKDAGNTTIGSFTIDDVVRTRTFNDGPRKYVGHTPCGADAIPPDSLSWNFHWQAPSTNAGPITLYLAGLAANHNHALSGDDTYTLQVHLVPDSTMVSVKDPASPGQLRIWPNPVTDMVYFESNGIGENIGAYKAEIWSTRGVLLRTILLSRNQLFVGELGEGIYFLQVYDRHKVIIGQATFVK